MPIGTLSWSRNRPDVFVGDSAADKYLVIHARTTALSAGQWMGVYLGNGALALVGTYQNQGDAFNGCNLHFTALAT